MLLRRIGLAALALAVSSCASAPPAPAPGRAVVAGTVRLVPHAGAADHAGGGDAYGDRRLHHVRRFDYSRPGFAVVYLDTAARPGGRVALAVQESHTGLRLAPEVEVVGVGGEIAVANRSSRSAVLSIPTAGRVESLAAGAEVAIAAERPGPLEIHLLGAADPALVWVSPGPWARPDASGRYALRDLPPGPARLRAWHPRLPAASAELVLIADETATVDFALGVGRGDERDGAH